MAVLHLFRGIPGSGKSTAASRMFPAVVRFENDMFCERDGSYQWNKDRVKEAIEWCTSSVRNALEHGMDVCVCNTFTKKRFIQRYKDMADELGARFDVYRCTGNFKNVHGLDSKMVDGFKNAMEDWPGETIVGLAK